MQRLWTSVPRVVVLAGNVRSVVEIKAPTKGTLRTISITVRTHAAAIPRVEVFSSQLAANAALIDPVAQSAAFATATANIPGGSIEPYSVTRGELIGGSGRYVSPLLELPYVNADGTTAAPGRSLWFVVFPTSSVSPPTHNVTIGIGVEPAYIA